MRYAIGLLTLTLAASSLGCGSKKKNAEGETQAAQANSTETPSSGAASAGSNGPVMYEKEGFGRLVLSGRSSDEPHTCIEVGDGGGNAEARAKLMAFIKKQEEKDKAKGVTSTMSEEPCPSENRIGEPCVISMPDDGLVIHLAQHFYKGHKTMTPEKVEEQCGMMKAFMKMGDNLKKKAAEEAKAAAEAVGAAAAQAE